MYKHVEVLDLNGKVVLERNNVSANDWLDISDQAPGIYHVRVFYDESEVTLKLVLEK
jgi:hypothetical protein